MDTEVEAVKNKTVQMHPVGILWHNHFHGQIRVLGYIELCTYPKWLIPDKYEILLKVTVHFISSPVAKTSENIRIYFKEWGK